MTGITKQPLCLSLAYAYQSNSKLKGNKLEEMLLLKQLSHPYIIIQHVHCLSSKADYMKKGSCRQGDACGKRWGVNAQIVIQT